MTWAPLSILPAIQSLPAQPGPIHRQRATLFLIILYVNCYCSMLARVVRFRTIPLRATPARVRHPERRTELKARAKPTDKPSTTRRGAVARLVPSSEPNIDDEAEERQRAGVQSLG